MRDEKESNTSGEEEMIRRQREEEERQKSNLDPKSRKEVDKKNRNLRSDPSRPR